MIKAPDPSREQQGNDISIGHKVILRAEHTEEDSKYILSWDEKTTTLKW